jgi:hypothetical protein
MFIEHSFQGFSDLEKLNIAFEEGIYGDFISGIEHAGSGIVASGGLLCQAKTTEAHRVGLLKSQIF